MAAKIRGLRWWMIGLLMVGSIINYLTRSTLSVAAPTIRDSLHITTEQYSWIVGTFQATIMLQPIAGFALDVLGLKIGFAIFAIAWSSISMSLASRPPGSSSPVCAGCSAWRRAVRTRPA